MFARKGCCCGKFEGLVHCCEHLFATQMFDLESIERNIAMIVAVYFWLKDIINFDHVFRIEKTGIALKCFKYQEI